MYYIINNNGNVLGESQNKMKIKMMLESYTKQEIKENELEIIKDEK